MKRQKSFENDKPTLYLVATPIGNLQEMTPRAIDILKSVDIIAAEDTRNTMKLLSYFEIPTKCIAHHMHNEYESAKGLLNLLDEGKNIAVVSDAGYPLISDPGQIIVNMVVDAGYNVVPISGANAALNALVASGLPTQPFMFVGFIKGSESERKKECEELSTIKQTLIFYEAPHRIKKTLDLFLEVFGNRTICLARELTKKHEEFIRGSIQDVYEICDDLKGEMVIVMEGCKEDELVEDIPFSIINDKIHHYIQEGYSTKEAIKKVAKDHGLSKNELYKQFHSN
ncbi:MAG: 16S rRNA (cytidine(1402)-2'-O)-methyltransferase [Traorella sp.]